MVCVEVLGLVLIAGSPTVAENGLKIGADGPDVGTDGVAPSVVHSGVTEPSGTWSESPGMVADVDIEVALESWTLGLDWTLERKERMYSLTLLMNDC